MLFDSDEKSDDSIYPSDFDLTRINGAEAGDSIEHELGNWKFLMYKNGCVLLLNNHKKFGSFQEFPSKEKCIEFLKKN